MSVSLEEKLAPTLRGVGTRARATLAQLRKMHGFVERDGQYLVVVMGGEAYGGETTVWRPVSGRGEEAIFEVM